LSPSASNLRASAFAKAVWLLASTALELAVIFGASYVLGHTMLFAGQVAGDAPLHLGYAYWLNQYFPEVPHWYPLQGGGESILHGYPILAHMLVVVLHRVSPLTLAQAFNVISFLSIPATAIGIYAYAWVVTRRQSIGLIAGLFFLLAPITWTWTYDWGFFPQGVGMIFLPPALICVDRYFEQNLQPRKGGLRRLWLVGACLSLSLAILAHPAVGAGVVAAFMFYVAVTSLLSGRSHAAATLKAGVKCLFAIGLVSGLIMSAYILPFYTYAGIANRDGLNVLGLGQLPKVPLAEFLGLRPIDPELVLTRIANPLAVSLLLVVGLVLSAFQSRKSASLIIVAVVAAIYSVFPWIPFSLGKASPLLSMLFGLRSTLVVVMILFPVGAAYGAYALSSTLVSAVFGLVGGAIRRTGDSAENRAIYGFVASGISILVACVMVLELGGHTSLLFGHAGYGPHAYGIDTRDIWGVRKSDPCGAFEQGGGGPILCSLTNARAKLNIEEFLVECTRLTDLGKQTPSLCKVSSPTDREVDEFLEQCEDGRLSGDLSSPCLGKVESLAQQLSPSKWPPLQVRDNPLQSGMSLEIESYLPPERPLRIEISPYMATLAQDFAAYSDTTQIASYTQQLSLIHLMWGYEINVLFSEHDGTPGALNDLADWLGLSHVILNPKYDSVDRFQEAGWTQVMGATDWDLWANPHGEPMLSSTTRPAFLVIGAPEKRVFFYLFRLANEGVLPYDRGLLVEGNGDLDTYSLEDLKNFDAVILHGYTYSKGTRAWELLYDYVSAGGSIFVDTGWQFEIPEWEFENAPPVLPAGSLAWTDYGRASQYELGDPDVAGDVSLVDFSPLIWEQDPWSVSSADKSEVRDWGRAVLSVEGHPIVIAGELGRGRVVWSGMNLLSHVVAYNNGEEARFLGNLLTWLVRGRQGIELNDTSVVRVRPDTVRLDSRISPGNITWLYWREAYYPNWHAYMSDGDVEHEIPIFRAGPGFILMPIESDAEGVSVRLAWEPSLAEKGALVLSAAGVLLLAALFLDGLLLDGNGFTWLRIALAMRMPAPILDEGSNLEMAEAQKAELEERHRGSPQGGGHAATHEHPSRGWPPGLTKRHPRPPVGGVTHEDESVETDVDEEQHALLQSWLDSSGHADDAWAARLIEKKQSRLGPKASPKR